MGGDKIFNIVVWYRKLKVYAQKHPVGSTRGLTQNQRCYYTRSPSLGRFIQLRPVVEAPALFAGQPGPLHLSEPCSTPHLGTPLSLVSHHPGTAGKAQKGVRDGMLVGPGTPPAGPPAQPRSLMGFGEAEPWVSGAQTERGYLRLAGCLCATAPGQ